MPGSIFPAFHHKILGIYPPALDVLDYHMVVHRPAFPNLRDAKALEFISRFPVRLPHVLNELAPLLFRFFQAFRPLVYLVGQYHVPVPFFKVRQYYPLHTPHHVHPVLPRNVLRRPLPLRLPLAPGGSIIPRIVPGYLLHVPEVVSFFYVQLKITPNFNILNE